jgi:hypothetical protein
MLIVPWKYINDELRKDKAWILTFKKNNYKEDEFRNKRYITFKSLWKKP